MSFALYKIMLVRRPEDVSAILIPYLKDIYLHIMITCIILIYLNMWLYVQGIKESIKKHFCFEISRFMEFGGHLKDI